MDVGAAQPYSFHPLHPLLHLFRMLWDLLIKKAGLSDSETLLLAASFSSVNEMLSIMDDADDLAQTTQLPLDVAADVWKIARAESDRAWRMLDLRKDVTKKRRLEENLMEEEKMRKSAEAVGRGYIESQIIGMPGRATSTR